MEAETFDESAPRLSKVQENWRIRNAMGERPVDDPVTIVMGGNQIASLHGSIEENREVRHPWSLASFASAEERQHHVDLKLRELVVSSAQIKLVEPESLAVYLPSISATVAIRAEGNEILIIVGFNRSPGGDVVNVHFDVAAGVDCASVSRLNQNASL